MCPCSDPSGLVREDVLTTGAPKPSPQPQPQQLDLDSMVPAHTVTSLSKFASGLEATVPPKGQDAMGTTADAAAKAAAAAAAKAAGANSAAYNASQDFVASGKAMTAKEDLAERTLRARTVAEMREQTKDLESRVAKMVADSPDPVTTVKRSTESDQAAKERAALTAARREEWETVQKDDEALQEEARKAQEVIKARVEDLSGVAVRATYKRLMEERTKAKEREIEAEKEKTREDEQKSEEGAKKVREAKDAGDEEEAKSRENVEMGKAQEAEAKRDAAAQNALEQSEKSNEVLIAKKNEEREKRRAQEELMKSEDYKYETPTGGTFDFHNPEWHSNATEGTLVLTFTATCTSNLLVAFGNADDVAYGKRYMWEITAGARGNSALELRKVTGDAKNMDRHDPVATFEGTSCADSGSTDFWLVVNGSSITFGRGETPGSWELLYYNSTKLVNATVFDFSTKEANPVVITNVKAKSARRRDPSNTYVPPLWGRYSFTRNDWTLTGSPGLISVSFEADCTNDLYIGFDDPTTSGKLKVFYEIAVGAKNNTLTALRTLSGDQFDKMTRGSAIVGYRGPVCEPGTSVAMWAAVNNTDITFGLGSVVGDSELLYYRSQTPIRVTSVDFSTASKHATLTNITVSEVDGKPYGLQYVPPLDRYPKYRDDWAGGEGEVYVQFLANCFNDMRVLFYDMSLSDVVQTKYEFVIGANNNKRSIVQALTVTEQTKEAEGGGAPIVTTTQNRQVLDELKGPLCDRDKFLPFWAMINGSEISFGQSDNLGDGELLWYRADSPLKARNFDFSSRDTFVTFEQIKWGKPKPHETAAVYAPPIKGRYLLGHKEWRVNSFGKMFVKFEVKCQRGATILLRGDEGEDMYEVVLGGWANTKSALRTVTGDPTSRNLQRSAPLFAKEGAVCQKGAWTPIWALIDTLEITVGRGRTLGEETFLSFKSPEPFRHQSFDLGSVGAPVLFRRVQFGIEDPFMVTNQDLMTIVRDATIGTRVWKDSEAVFGAKPNIWPGYYVQSFSNTTNGGVCPLGGGATIFVNDDILFKVIVGCVAGDEPADTTGWHLVPETAEIANKTFQFFQRDFRKIDSPAKVCCTSGLATGLLLKPEPPIVRTAIDHPQELFESAVADTPIWMDKDDKWTEQNVPANMLGTAYTQPFFSKDKYAPCANGGGARYSYTGTEGYVAYVACSSGDEPLESGWSVRPGNVTIAGDEEARFFARRFEASGANITVCCSKSWATGVWIKADDVPVTIDEAFPQALVSRASSSVQVWADKDVMMPALPRGADSPYYIRSFLNTTKSPVCQNGGGASFRYQGPSPYTMWVACKESTRPEGDGWTINIDTFKLQMSSETQDKSHFFSKRMNPSEETVTVCCGDGWTTGVYVKPEPVPFDTTGDYPQTVILSPDVGTKIWSDYTFKFDAAPNGVLPASYYIESAFDKSKGAVCGDINNGHGGASFNYTGTSMFTAYVVCEGPSQPMGDDWQPLEGIFNMPKSNSYDHNQFWSKSFGANAGQITVCCREGLTSGVFIRTTPEPFTPSEKHHVTLVPGAKKGMQMFADSTATLETIPDQLVGAYYMRSNLAENLNPPCPRGGGAAFTFDRRGSFMATIGCSGGDTPAGAGWEELKSTVYLAPKAYVSLYSKRFTSEDNPVSLCCNKSWTTGAFLSVESPAAIGHSVTAKRMLLDTEAIQVVDRSMAMPQDGNINGFEFATKAGGAITMMVFRPVTDSLFMIVGSMTFEAKQGVNKFRLSNSGEIAARTGDMIGWQTLSKQGVIDYESGGSRVDFSPAQEVHRVGDVREMQFQQLRTYSVRATYTPLAITGHPIVNGENYVKHQQYMYVDTRLQFEEDSVVKAFDFYVGRPGPHKLCIWRREDPSAENTYTLVSSVEVTSIKAGRDRVDLEEGSELWVRRGDLLGWAHTGPGVLSYSKNAAEGEKGYVEWIRGPLPNAGEVANLTKTNDMTFSVRAVSEPVPSVGHGVFRRTKVDKPKGLQVVDKALAFPANGVLRGWEFFAQNKGVVHLIVWRRLGGDSYGILSLRVVNVKKPGLHRIQLTLKERVSVQQGDLLGWQCPDKGVIAYSPSGAGQAAWSNMGAQKEGEKRSLTIEGSRTYSIRAYYTLEPAIQHELIDRGMVDQTGSVTMIDRNLQLRHDGVLSAWEFYARAPGTHRLQIWRTTHSLSQYQLVGETHLETGSVGLQRVDLPAGHGLRFRKGDFIGWRVDKDGKGVLTYDRSGDGDVTYVYDDYVPQVGKPLLFAQTAQRTYSIRAMYRVFPNIGHPVFRRESLDRTTLFMAVETTSVFPSSGKVTGWRYHASAAGVHKLVVWRRTGYRTYMMIGEVFVRAYEGYNLVELPEKLHVQVRRGDMIGWLHNGPGLLAYSDGGIGRLECSRRKILPRTGQRAKMGRILSRTYAVAAVFEPDA